MYKFFRFIYYEILFNGHLQAIGASLIILTISLLLYNELLYVVFAFSTYFLFESFFLFDRYKDIIIDSESNTERSRHLQSFKNFIPGLIVIYTFISLSLLFISKVSFLSISLTILILVAGICYPIFFKKLTKHIPFLKNIYVSLVYSILPFYFISLANIIGTINYGILFIIAVYIFGESFISQVTLDTKDTITDKKSKLKTITRYVDFNDALKVTLFLSIISAGFFLYSYFIFEKQLIFFYLVLLNLIINCLSIRLLLKKNRYGYILMAAKFSLWFIPFIFVII